MRTTDSDLSLSASNLIVECGQTEIAVRSSHWTSVCFSKNGQPLLNIIQNKRLRLTVRIGHVSALVKCPLGQVVLYNIIWRFQYPP